MFIVSTENIKIVGSVKVASRMMERMIGLMFVNEMKDFNGLLIKSCNSIHTFFMRFNLDVVFMNKNFKIIKIIRDISPWRITGIYFKACQVLELKAGTLPNNLKEGDVLTFEEEVCIN